MVEEKKELKRELCVLTMIACCWHFKVIYVSWIIGVLDATQFCSLFIILAASW